jgi:hypothetical protein
VPPATGAGPQLSSEKLGEIERGLGKRTDLFVDVLSESGEAGFVFVRTPSRIQALSNFGEDLPDGDIGPSALGYEASERVFGTLGLAKAGDDCVGVELEDGADGDHVVEEPCFGVGVCTTEGSRQRRCDLAVGGTAGLELAEPLLAGGFVLVDGGDDAFEAFVTGLADREAELTFVAFADIQPGPGSGGSFHLGSSEDLDEGWIHRGISLAVPDEEEPDH